VPVAKISGQRLVVQKDGAQVTIAQSMIDSLLKHLSEVEKAVAIKVSIEAVAASATAGETPGVNWNVKGDVYDINVFIVLSDGKEVKVETVHGGIELSFEYLV